MYNLDCPPANLSKMEQSIQIDLNNWTKALRWNALGMILQGYPSWMHHFYLKNATVNKISHHVSVKVSIFKSLENMVWLSLMNTDVVTWKKMAPKGSDTVKRCGLIGGNVSLWG